MAQDKLTEEEKVILQAEEVAKQKAIQVSAEIAAEQVKQTKAADATAMSLNVLPTAAEKISETHLTSEQKQNVTAQLHNEKKLYEEGKRQYQTKDAPEKESGIASQFREALTYFAPQILGGFLSQELSGTGDQGFVAGFDQGGKARDSFINYKQEERAAVIQKQEAAAKRKASLKTDITPEYQMKDTGEPVYMQETADGGVKVMTGDKTEVDPRDIVSIRSAQQSSREVGINERFTGRLDDKQIDRQEKTLKAFVDKPDIRKGIGAKDTMSPIINMLESKMPVTSDFLAPFVARGVQKEVGNLSETDLKNARVPMAFYQKIKSNISGFIKGDMTDEERGQLVNLLTFMQERNDEQLSKKLEGYATKERADRIGITREELIEQMSQESGITYKKRRTSKIPSSAEINKMSIEELKAAGLL